MTSGGGQCNTLQYAPEQGPGYANLTTQYYMGVRNVQNYQQCCAICSNDPNCAAWTRVAGTTPPPPLLPGHSSATITN